MDQPEMFADENGKSAMLLLGRPVKVLDEGSHKPVLFSMETTEGEPCGDWVVKPPCSFPNGTSAVLRELAAAQLAARVGVIIPQFALVRLPPSPRRVDGSKVGRHVAGWLAKDAEKLAFCSRYLRGINFNGDGLKRVGRPKQAMARDCVFAVLFDVLCRNYDRSSSNPNLIQYKDRIVSIDFDCAFYHAEAIDEAGCSAEENDFTDWESMKRHPLWSFVHRETADDAWLEFEERVTALSEQVLDEMARAWPSELEDHGKGGLTDLRRILRVFIGDRVKKIPALIQEVRRHAVSRG